MEGGIIFGIGAALWNEVTIENGRVQQSNFHDYRSLRINEAPKIEVHLVRTREAPGGVGEPGTAAAAPAVANAVFAATGKRIRKAAARKTARFGVREDTMRMLYGFVAALSVLPFGACSRSEAAEAAPASSEPFDAVASVLMYPRCINCHQVDSPRQTDAKIFHQPLVVRGKDGHGAPTLQCQTCHQATNTAEDFVPGVATWGLAPLSMLWEGKTKAQICEQVKDPKRKRRPAHR